MNLSDIKVGDTLLIDEYVPNAKVCLNKMEEGTFEIDTTDLKYSEDEPYMIELSSHNDNILLKTGWAGNGNVVVHSTERLRK